ncbi:hypothetical protein HN748_02240 [Candidatus Peregrinibacteria bacterium]|jgi:hypothetical protein|nr:hypothetical protein [Candidatus Peregrinibacteria bacterium]MBT7483782.1 hypothetical protein [Candidatus Peregrinibacteria bacterium]MBT7703028.1 hypothetical protein [Candidatus Peregrinibacteria bacterium]
MNSERDNTNRHFRGQQSAERVMCFCRKHPIILLRVVTITLILISASIMALLFIPVTQIKDHLSLQILIFTLLVFITLAQHVFFLRLLNYYLDIVIITNYRIIDLKKSLFIHDEKEIIDLHEIQDTQKMQTGLLPNFLNYGDIKIVVPSMTRAMVLPYMPRPEYYLNQINQCKRFYILERRKQKQINAIPVEIPNVPTNAHQ